MKVLVACEFSGVVRDAFRARGHQAMSVDLLPSERPGPHLAGDVIDLLQRMQRANDLPDLLIAFPPCTPRVHHAAPGPNRWKERSRTLPGIADAMAEQWGAA